MHDMYETLQAFACFAVVAFFAALFTPFLVAAAPAMVTWRNLRAGSLVSG